MLVKFGVVVVVAVAVVVVVVGIHQMMCSSQSYPWSSFLM